MIIYGIQITAFFFFNKELAFFKSFQIIRYIFLENWRNDEKHLETRFNHSTKDARSQAYWSAPHYLRCLKLNFLFFFPESQFFTGSEHLSNPLDDQSNGNVFRLFLFSFLFPLWLTNINVLNCFLIAQKLILIRLELFFQ